MAQGVEAEFGNSGPAAEAFEEFGPIVIGPASVRIGKNIGAVPVPVVPSILQGLAAPGRKGHPAGRQVPMPFLPGPEAHPALGALCGGRPIHVSPGEIIELPDSGPGVQKQLQISLVQRPGQKEDNGELLRGGHKDHRAGQGERLEAAAGITVQVAIIHRQFKDGAQRPEMAVGVMGGKLLGQGHEFIPHHRRGDFLEKQVFPLREPPQHCQVVPVVSGRGIGLEEVQAMVRRL